jgi:diacylglycerol O-acyltransferase
MVDRMSPLDAAFIDLEDEDPHASMAIASVAVAEGPAPTHEDFVDAIRARLPLLPRYRQRAWSVPLDLGPPVWADDPRFDITHHIRRTALPAPGDDQALSRLVGRVMSQRLDRERPLWEYWVVEGLAGGRWALISKAHHCMVDGISGTHLYYLLCDASPDGPGALPPDTWNPSGEPTALGLIGDALRELALNPMEQLRLVGGALRSPRATAARFVETARGLATLVGALRPAAASSLVGPIGRQRRYAVARASLADVKHVARQAQVSVNDVVLAAITAAFREILRRRDERPDPHAVRSLVPVSVRAPGDEGTCDNRISMLLASLPVHLEDPTMRLRAVHEHLTQLKASKEAQAGEAMTTLARHEPFPPVAWGMRAAAHLPQRTIVTVTTNVPGPRQPLYLMGRRIVEILPYVPIGARLRTGISIFTYCDQVTFGVTGDYDRVGDIDALALAVRSGVEELVAAYRPGRSRARARSPVPARPARRKATPATTSG